MASERFTDDTTIADDSELWRRIHPTWVVFDGNTGTWQVSSAAFDDSKNGSPTSVLLADLVRESGRTAQDVIANYSGYSLASITAGEARGCGQGVARNALPDEPAHAYVFGQKTKAAERCLARHAKWVIAPQES